MLDRAQGVLIALRRCTVDAAFEEIGRASMRHRVAQVAHRRGAGHSPRIRRWTSTPWAAARYEWGSLFEQVSP